MPGNRNPLLVSLLLGLPVILAGSALAWWLLDLPTTGIDDADIFLVYARNLAQGHGFTYNIGERVEGFTSMLWVLICSGLFRLFHTCEAPLALLNLLFGCIVLTACLRHVKRFVLFLLLAAAAPAWFAWSHLTLMETGLWGMLLTLMVLAVAERRSDTVALLVPFLVLTRPESMLWCPWAILVMGIGAASEAGWRQGLKTMALPLVNFIVALTGLLVFRLMYFGYPVPNTYYAKVSPDLLVNLRSGLDYLYRYLISNPVVFLVVGTWGAVLADGLRRRRFDRSLLVALCLLPGLGIPVLVGGDHFAAFRFYQPIWPLLCLLAAWVLPSWIERAVPRLRWWIFVALCIIGWILFALPDPYHLKNEFRIAREGRATGVALQEISRELDPAPTVAAITAGGVKYTYPGKVFDLMGLNSIEMAHAPGSRTGVKNHSAFNREIFYQWSPDILICGDSAEFDSKVLKGLHDEDQFDRRYAKGTLRRHGGEVTAYFSRRFLASLPDLQFEPAGESER